MTGFLDIKNFFDPRNNLMRAGIGWLIKVDYSVLEIIFKRALKWGRSCRDRCIVGRKNIHFMIIFE
jgi:hypothetical protein